jgi:hypothetical protein
MIDVWMGTALLAGSWLLGVNYFSPVSPWAWLAAVAAAVVLFSRAGHRFACPAACPKAEGDVGGESSRSWIALSLTIVLLLPAIWFAPWPYRMGPLLMAIGLLLILLPSPRQWPKRLACGALTSGVILLVQGLAIETYAAQTARSHELPWPFADLLAAFAGLLGIDAVADGSNVVIHSMRQVHRLGATWEWLLDPATLCFFVGGLTMLAISVRAVMPAERRLSAWLRSACGLTLILLAWLPLRAGLLMAVYLHRILRSDAEQPLHAMNHFFSPWMLIALLIVPVLLAWRFIRWPEAITEADAPLAKRQGGAAKASVPVVSRTSAVAIAGAACLIAFGVAMWTAAVDWDPVGRRKEGRVMFVERHSTWEPTTKPYDTTQYGEAASYNYAAIYDYLAQYFQMSRLLENEPIDDNTLQSCDVLIIKTPTARYSDAEVRAVQRFVKQGGGLLLVGDHTNLDRSSTIMNDIARPMGFTFRNDLLFSFEESPYEELYERSVVPHPAVQHVPRMDFAVSCSVDPGFSCGRPIIVGTRLWSMGPDYEHFENFHPIPQHCDEMRYGAFIQAWSARFGQGRAVAFADSTVFSNFCVFQPGKAEIMLDLVEWLNHANPPWNPRPWLIGLGLPLLLAGAWMARQRERSWLLMMAAGACGWAATSWAVNLAHGWAMPLPECKRPQVRVVIDRTTSSVPLSKGPNTGGSGEGFGLLEQWIPRLRCTTVRKEGAEAFSGDVLTVIGPTRFVSESFRERLIRYVRDGGNLVVIDSPENMRSTANSLLWPFGLAMRHDQAWQGTIQVPGQTAEVKIERACEVAGGRPIARLDQLPIAATISFGKGAVLAVGFGSLWNDTNMGEHWMPEPDATVRARYDVLYAILRPFVDGSEIVDLTQKDDKPLKDARPNKEGRMRRAIPPPIDVPAENPIERNDLPLKESGPAEL